MTIKGITIVCLVNTQDNAPGSSEPAIPDFDSSYCCSNAKVILLDIEISITAS